jgi:hypothetical protein
MGVGRRWAGLPEINRAFLQDQFIDPLPSIVNSCRVTNIRQNLRLID